MKPFLSGKKSLVGTEPLAPIAPLVPLGTPATLRPHPVTGKTHASPNIEVVKEGDKVVRLVVTCSCGERMEVECLYPAGY
jgi:hypothetical protein